MAELNTSVSGSTLNFEHPLSPDVLARVEREREFFNRYSDPQQVPSESLRLPQNFELFPAIRSIVPQLSSKLVCDYGCGYGLAGAYFARHGAIVYSFDVSENNAQIARRTADANGVADRMTVHQMPGERLTFPDNFFDYILGTAILHHVDIDLAGRELYRVLKPGGMAIFAEPLGENKLLEWLRHSSWWEANHRHSPDEHSLRYSEIRTLKNIFDRVSMHEIGLFSVLKPALRKIQIGMIAVPRWQGAMRFLESLDEVILRTLPFMRPLAYYVEVTMSKSASAG